MGIHKDAAADEAIRRNIGAGYHYFDPDTMRAFGSKVHEGYRIHDGVILLIMSNRDRFGHVLDGKRHYYLGAIMPDGDMRHLPGQYRYDLSHETGYTMSLRSARTQAQALANFANTSGKPLDVMPY